MNRGGQVLVVEEQYYHRRQEMAINTAASALERQTQNYDAWTQNKKNVPLCGAPLPRLTRLSAKKWADHDAGSGGMWLGQCPVRVRLPEASALERKPFARGNRAFEHVFNRERGRGAVWSVESIRESLFRCPTTPSPDYMALLPGEQHAILRWRHEGTPRSCKPREIPRPSICRFTPYHQPKERLEHPYPTNQTSSSAVLHAQERTEGRSTR